jgi:hypothetical protein
MARPAFGDPTALRAAGMLIRPLRQIPLLILCSARYQRKKFRCYALA